MADRTAKPTQTAQKGFGLPSCPYCGKKVNPIHAWGIKSKGEYHCSQCGTFSNIKLDKFIYFAGLIALVLEALILLLFIFTGSTLVYLLPLMVLPFLCFTVLAAFSVRLEKIGISQKRKAPAAAQKGPRRAAPEPRPAEKKEKTGEFSLEKDTTLQFQKLKNKDHPKRIDETKH